MKMSFDECNHSHANPNQPSISHTPVILKPFLFATQHFEITLPDGPLFVGGKLSILVLYFSNTCVNTDKNYK